MPREIALKRLSETDLTFFRWHYENQEFWRSIGTRRANQKGININAAPLLRLYPAFKGLPSDRVNVSLRLLGPGGAAAEAVTRKIKREAKNWRLDGEMVSNPVESPERFNGLRESDLVLFRFQGEGLPTHIDAVFLQVTNREDESLHRALSPLVPQGGRESMVLIDASALLDTLDELNVSVDSPIRQLLADLDNDLVVAGEPGTSVAEKQSERGVFRGRLSPEALALARERQMDVGQRGEEMVDFYLREAVARGEFTDMFWVSQDNAISPYDFIALEGETEIRVEVKSTTLDFGAAFHVSVNEIRALAEEPRYDLYRLYSMDTEAGTAKLRIAADPKDFADVMLEAVAAFPAGVVIGQLVVTPALLDWSDETQISLDDIPEDK